MYAYVCTWASLVTQTVKRHLQCKRPGFNPRVGKILEEVADPTPSAHLPGKSHETEEPGQATIHEAASRTRLTANTFISCVHAGVVTCGNEHYDIKKTQISTQHLI